jgi:hypothetical protein
VKPLIAALLDEGLAVQLVHVEQETTGNHGHVRIKTESGVPLVNSSDFPGVMYHRLATEVEAELAKLNISTSTASQAGVKVRSSSEAALRKLPSINSQRGAWLAESTGFQKKSGFHDRTASTKTGLEALAPRGAAELGMLKGNFSKTSEAGAKLRSSSGPVFRQGAPSSRKGQVVSRYALGKVVPASNAAESYVIEPFPQRR